MCKPASFVVTKDKVFWSKVSDSHEDIIKEFSLTAEVAGKICIVRCEIKPPKEGRFDLPAEKWIYKTDQDGNSLPKWFDAAEVEARCRVELDAWIDTKVVLKGRLIQKLEYGVSVFVCGGTVNEVRGWHRQRGLGWHRQRGLGWHRQRGQGWHRQRGQGWHGTVLCFIHLQTNRPSRGGNQPNWHKSQVPRRNEKNSNRNLKVTMQTAIQKAAAAMGRIKSTEKAIAARKNGFLCKPRTQSEIDAHNAEVMRSAIRRATHRQAVRKAMRDPQRELSNNFTNRK